MTGENLRTKRAAAGITGRAICEVVTGLNRPRLSDIERGYAEPSPHEANLIEAAIDHIIRTRQRLEQLAADEGLSLAGIRIE